MKPTFLFLAAILGYINSSAQNGIKTDSTRINKKSPIGKLGFYIEPAYASGKLIGRIPLDHDPADNFSGYWISYFNIKPELTFGYTTGFEVQIEQFNQFSIKTGISFQFFKYSANADVGSYDTHQNPPQFTYVCSECYSFYYKDYYLHFPISAEYYFLKTTESALFLELGSGISYNFSESMSGYEKQTQNHSKVNLFGIGGIGFSAFAGPKTIFKFEPVF